MQFSSDQQLALQGIEDFLSGPPGIFVLGGYAGSGKSTLLRHISENRSALRCAPTHRAASLISGVTVASLLRAKPFDPLARLRERLEDLIATIEFSGDPQRQADLMIEKESVNAEILRREKDGETMSFSPDGAKFEDDEPPQLVIIDEVSMCDDETERLVRQMSEDYEVHVLAVGDPAQLPPVGRRPGFTRQDAVLTTVHRQANGSPIALACQSVRTTPDITTIERSLTKMERRRPKNAIQEADILLSTTNRGVQELNRARVGDLTRDPKPGDLLLSRQMFYAPSSDTAEEDPWVHRKVYKGERFRVLEHLGQTRLFHQLLLQREGGDYFRVRAPKDVLEDHTNLAAYHMKPALAWGYGMTVHSSQGGQWPKCHLRYYPGRFDDDTKRKLIYTAISRTIDTFTVG